MSHLAYADKTLTCRDCGNQFTFTAAEQESFVQKGFFNDPSRCNDCRAARKARTGGASRDGDRGTSSSSGFSDSSRSRGPREMFETVCSECGQTAQVPFQPRNDKPVYCSNCFEQKRSYR